MPNALDVKFKKVNESARIPLWKSGASGLLLQSNEIVTINSFDAGQISTGLKASFPPMYIALFFGKTYGEYVVRQKVFEYDSPEEWVVEAANLTDAPVTVYPGGVLGTVYFIPIFHLGVREDA